MDGLADGSLTPVPQALDGVSLAPKIDVQDAQVRWDRPAVAVDRQVRGCTPAPGAWSTFRGERVKLLPVQLDEGYAGSDLAPGELAAGKREVHVGTATGPVRLSHVRPHGKKEMTAADWARGVRIDAGERFSHE
jgi:methionyl-tRNA formyltransferase